MDTWLPWQAFPAAPSSRTNIKRQEDFTFLHPLLLGIQVLALGGLGYSENTHFLITAHVLGIPEANNTGSWPVSGFPKASHNVGETTYDRTAGDGVHRL